MSKQASITIVVNKIDSQPKSNENKQTDNNQPNNNANNNVNGGSTNN